MASSIEFCWLASFFRKFDVRHGVLVEPIVLREFSMR